MPSFINHVLSLILTESRVCGRFILLLPIQPPTFWKKNVFIKGPITDGLGGTLNIYQVSLNTPLLDLLIPMLVYSKAGITSFFQWKQDALKVQSAINVASSKSASEFTLLPIMILNPDSQTRSVSLISYQQPGTLHEDL